MTGLLGRLDLAIRALARVIATSGLLLLFLNAFAVVADVLLRALLNAPIDRLPDVSSVVFYLAGATALPIATAYRRHVTIRALEAALRPRGRELLDGFASAVTTAVFAVIAWQIALFTLEVADAHRTLWQFDIEIAPFWWIVTGLLGLTVLIEGLAALRHFAAALAPGTPDLPPTS